ncbi:uncharacterized protein LOC121854567, partial [Homarus americanus]|uniref:uncharacterized protein LOC121854567 n=1 Tax=Homarus americanus TaxID=6706 RepID=UPI001C448261
PSSLLHPLLPPPPSNLTGRENVPALILRPHPPSSPPSSPLPLTPSLTPALTRPHRPSSPPPHPFANPNPAFANPEPSLETCYSGSPLHNLDRWKETNAGMRYSECMCRTHSLYGVTDGSPPLLPRSSSLGELTKKNMWWCVLVVVVVVLEGSSGQHLEEQHHPEEHNSKACLESCSSLHLTQSLSTTSRLETVANSPNVTKHRRTRSVYPTSVSPREGNTTYEQYAHEDRPHHAGADLKFPQEQQSVSVATSVTGNTESQENLSKQILLSLTLNIPSDKIPVILHDSEAQSVNVLDHFLRASLGLSAVIINISGGVLPIVEWLDEYNDGYFVHIIIFSSVSVVESFVEGLPELVWTPDHLLLINVDESVNATHLLAQEKFSHSLYLSLLQPHNRMGAGHYLILTLETFRPLNKITSHGIYSVTKPRAFSEVFPDRFQSFYGYKIQLASWPDDFPYLIPGPTLEKTYGMCVNMLNEISAKLNFSYVFDSEAEASWGELVNGSWIGMVGQVSRKEKDMSVNVIAVDKDRYTAVDLSVIYMTDSFSFVLRIPTPPPRWWSIVFPFTWQTWVAVFAFLVVISAQLSLFYKVRGVARSSSEAVLVIMRTLLRQDVPNPPSHVSIRVIQGAWMIVAMILSISYTGNLVAYITVPEKPIRLTSLKQLAESSLTPTMVDYGNFVPGALRASKHPTLHVLGQKLQLIPDYGYDVGFAQVMDGTHAFLEGTEFFNYMVILYHMSTTTYFLPEVIYSTNVAWIYPKKTPWKHKLDPYLQAFVESGLCLYWKKVLVYDFMKQMGENLHQDTSVPLRPLSLQDLQGTFIIYGLFTLASILVGVLEMLFHP